MGMRYVRPFIAVSCLYGSFALVLMEKDVPEWLLALTTLTVAWWFKARDEEKKNGVVK